MWSERGKRRWRRRIDAEVVGTTKYERRVYRLPPTLGAALGTFFLPWAWDFLAADFWVAFCNSGAFLGLLVRAFSLAALCCEKRKRKKWRLVLIASKQIDWNESNRLIDRFKNRPKPTGQLLHVEPCALPAFGYVWRWFRSTKHRQLPSGTCEYGGCVF